MVIQPSFVGIVHIFIFVKKEARTRSAGACAAYNVAGHRPLLSGMDLCATKDSKTRMPPVQQHFDVIDNHICYMIF